MAMKLYVGGLSYSVKDADLEALFAEHGTVASAKVITDRDSGQSKGFGFVELNDDAEAKAAMAALNGKEIDGRSLTVNEARPQVDRR
jgi:cold-inducible RNA-binding protein